MSLEGRHLGNYLNDHLSGSRAGLELARRAARAHRGTRRGDFLAQLSEDIAADRRSLELLMGQLGLRRDPIKAVGGWIGGKLARLKPNAPVIGRAPLSSVIELEMLELGVSGKLALWRTLLEVADADPRLSREVLEDLRTRAEGQRDAIEDQRLATARDALVARAHAPVRAPARV